MNKDKKNIYKDMMSDEKVRSCLATKDKPESLDDLANVVGGVALENGYPLSEDDLIALFKEMKESTDEVAKKVEKLSEADLAAVAGGGGNNAANYICADTYKDKENCWFNDGCDFTYNWYPYYICKRSELDIPWEIVPYNP